MPTPTLAIGSEHESPASGHAPGGAPKWAAVVDDTLIPLPPPAAQAA